MWYALVAMKPHPRIRKTIKWGGAAVTVLLAVVWVGSAWFQWQVSQSPTLSIDFGGGRITVGTSDVRPVWPRPTLLNVPPRLRLGYQETLVGDIAIRWIPIWPIVLASLLCSATAWRLDTLARRRAKLNLCPKCGYDRTGLASKDAKCPECGAAPASV